MEFPWALDGLAVSRRALMLLLLLGSSEEPVLCSPRPR